MVFQVWTSFWKEKIWSLPLTLQIELEDQNDYSFHPGNVVIPDVAGKMTWRGTISPVRSRETRRLLSPDADSSKLSFSRLRDRFERPVKKKKKRKKKEKEKKRQRIRVITFHRRCSVTLWPSFRPNPHVRLVLSLAPWMTSNSSRASEQVD